jgi:heme exporter protein D
VKVTVYWDSVGSFLAMGGYGGYVWGAYGVTAVLLVGEVLLVRRRHGVARALVRRLARLGKTR